jgi:DNA-binding NarL/FixJ family response regulator
VTDRSTTLDVLLVEDSETDCKLIVRELQRSGFAPSWERVETATELREAFQRRTWQLVISDSSVTRLSPLEALAMTKALAPQVPFIVVSGTITEETAVQAVRSGAADYISKDRLERLGAAALREISAGGQRADAAAKRTRILLADDHTLVRAGMRSLLESLPKVEIVGEVGDGLKALQLIGRLHPDVALMDVSLSGMNGLEAARRAFKRYPRTRVVMLANHADQEQVSEALVAGVAGYLLKSAEPAELAMALSAVGRGEVWISPGVSRAVVGTLARYKLQRAETLTPRQREVLQLVAEGHSTKDIARRLRISAKTVDTHRAQIMERLDIHRVAGLVRYAIRAGIVGKDVPR